MLDFTCPSCQTRFRVLDSYAGKVIICQVCAKSVNVPFRSEPQTGITAAEPGTPLPPIPEEDPEIISIVNDGVVGVWRRRIGCGIALLVPIGVVLLLLLPVWYQSQELMNRMRSASYIGQIVKGMNVFESFEGRLPFNGTRPAVGSDKESGSWAFQILPYVDYHPIFANPADGNNVNIPMYRCPGRGRSTTVTTGPVTDYFINIYLNTKTIGNGWDAADRKLLGKDITDGFSATIYIGEGWVSDRDYGKAVIPGVSDSIFRGGRPELARGGKNVVAVGTGPEVVVQRDSKPLAPGTTLIPWGGPFPQGVMCGCGDSVVKTFPYTMSGTTFGAFLTPSNREKDLLPD